jgi:hypothetical protein
MKRKITTLILSCILAVSSFAAQVIYVSPTGDDGNEGTQGSPYASLAKATMMVSEDGAVIHVAPGTYVFAATAVLKPFNQSIIGADAATTIFDGNNEISLIDGITEMELSEKSVSISKLAFKKGYLLKTAADLTPVPGGSAIRMGAKTNLTLEDCYFHKNVTASPDVICWAGAVYFAGNSITVNKCFFEENQTPRGYGGGLTVRHILNLDGTTAHTSYGPTYAVIKNSTFYKNAISSKGGAIYFNKQLDANPDDDDATFVVQNCVFLENTTTTAAQVGAAIALSSGSNSANNKMQTIVLTNNTMVDNYNLTTEGAPDKKNAVLLEGFRYVAHLANNIMVSRALLNHSLFANQNVNDEFGMNNIIDVISPNISGADFTTDALTKKNQVTAVTAEAIGISKTLTAYPVGSVFSVPYLSTSTGSIAINGGTNSLMVATLANPTPVEFVLQEDILGHMLQEGTRDIGAFEANVTSVRSVSTDLFTITNEHNGIKIFNLNKGDKVMVYDSRGSLQYANSPDESDTTVPLKNVGIYIISINGKAQKHIYR